MLLASILAATIAVIASFATARAAKPLANNGQFSIAAQPNPVLYGRTVTISGRLKGGSSVGQPVTLQHDPYPYDTYTDAVAGVTVAEGAYSFVVTPLLNTRYRVITTARTPQEITGDVTVQVRKRVSLRISDRTPRRGQLIRFYGTVAPQHDGSTLRIQRRSSTGEWVTVAKTLLRDDGDARSAYSRRLRVYRDGVFRAYVVADADHAAGNSGSRSVDVHR